MSSGITNQSHPEQDTLQLMEDLEDMLGTEILPTHVPLIQLIDKICKNPSLNRMDLYSKYTRLATVVGGDWITVKEELRNATRFGAAAFYCSISAMLVVFTCRRSRSHDELVSSLTELYNHISAGNKILNKQVEHAITTMGKQMEHANVAEASVANLNERVDNAITAMEKQEELVKKAEASITTIIERADHVKSTMETQVKQVNKAEVSVTNIIEQANHIKTTIEKQVESSIADVIERADIAIKTIDKKMKQTNTTETSTPLAASSNFTKGNKDVVIIPGTTFECKYGTLTIDDQSRVTFHGSSMDAKSLALWLTLPVPHSDRARLMNLNHEQLISLASNNVTLIHNYKHNFTAEDKKGYIQSLFELAPYRARQWCFIS